MKEIYLGLDICKNNIQLSYYREDKQEPESICQLNYTDTYQLPYVMFYSEEEKTWYLSNHVNQVRFQRKGVIVENLLEQIDSTETMKVGDRTYTYEDLFLLFLRQHIEEFLVRSDEYMLCGLSVSLQQYQEKLYAVLWKLREELSLSEEHFYIMSHENAFFQFVMNQDAALQNNSVAMFEYGKEGMEYYRIDRKYQGNTRIYQMRRKDMQEEMTYSMLFEDIEKLDKKFAEIARIEMKETYISTVFLTGPGFHDNWIADSKKVICDGRRVFMGQNIYTKGACYHARFGAYEKGKDCVFLNEGSIPFDIGVCVGDLENRNYFHLIATGGQEWYNMKGKVQLFLDDTKRVEIIYRDKISKEIQKEVIEIHGLPKRPPKTTKISLEIELYEERMGAIVIRDVGFGKIYPTTNKIYRKEFRVTSGS